MTDSNDEQAPSDAPAPAAPPAPAPEAPPSGTPWSRYLMIGLPIVAVVIAVVWIWWPKWEIKLAINGLHASDGRSRAEHITTLKDHADKGLVIDELLASVQDDDHTFSVRRMCCDLLVDHFNRLPKLNPLLKNGSLHTRGVILTALSYKDYYQKEYVDDPRYRVRETIVEWLRNKDDMTRVYAIQQAVRIKMKSVMPDIRPLIARSGRANVHGTEERDLMIAAAGAVERFADCESTSNLLDVVEKDTDYLVRLRFMQVLERAAFRERPAAVCKGSVDETRMRALVQKGLGDEDHRVRMGALLILAKHTSWTEGVEDRLLAILDGSGTAAERRQALEALIASGKPAFLERFPQYFHDDAIELRRTSSRSLQTMQGMGLEGCWVGLFADLDPTPGKVLAQDPAFALWFDALEALARIGKERQGFPMALSVKASNAKPAYRADMGKLFTTGELVIAETDGTFARLTRDGVAEAWFRWWCADRGVEKAGVEKAIAAWRACHAAMKRGDVAAATAALDGAGLESVPQGLFVYERAWIAKQGR